MRKRFLTGLFCIALYAAIQAQIPDLKSRLIRDIDDQSEQLIRMSDEIWSLAETAFEEHQSSEILASYAEQMGMRVQRGVADIPTAFIASYGSGKPIIGILGEFDALPGVSQKTLPEKAPLKDGAPGHGCGHNMFGAGSMGAAVAIKHLIESGDLQGTVRFYGTPAEEKYFGKLYMARAGLFDDLDVCLDWHPGAQIKAVVQSNLALVDFQVEFFGQSAHAALDPWNGRSASDGLEIYTVGINYLREHVKPSVRIHYHTEQSGSVANIVPDYARIWTRVRDNSLQGMLSVYERVKEIARGAAIIASVDYKISLMSGLHEILVNRTGGAILQKNLEALGPIRYTEEELAFARTLQESTGQPKEGIDGNIYPLEETHTIMEGASSDVGDVSWIVPEIQLSVTTAPLGTPWHSWAVVACGGMSIGHKGLIYAAKALGMTMVDLLNEPDVIDRIEAEFRERRADIPYEPLLPEGPPPIPVDNMKG
ncbi:MAG: amidohydrolase [Saprospiraceae bacterium]|nr:amidohydrolase [Saprospiraceae bacterium]